MNFLIQLSDQERQDIARALAILIRALTNGIPKDSAKEPQLPGRLFPATVEAKPVQAASESRGGRATATALLSPPSSVEQMPPRDRWSNAWQANTPQKQAEGYTVRIWKCDQETGKRGPFLYVRWGSSTSTQPRHAYCHDKELFPWILNASKTREQIILYLVQQDNFQKIVGVKA